MRCARTGRPASIAVFLTVLFCARVFAAGSDAADRDSTLILTGATMGTTYTVKLHDPDGKTDVEGLQSQIDALLDRVNAQMSTWRPDSELSRFNASRSSDWFRVSEEIVFVVDAAAAISRLSDGAFDVTVGPIVNLWGFGPEGHDMKPPSARQIEQVMGAVGYAHLTTRDRPPALRKNHPDVYVDLSAIAKGFAVDRVASLLDEENIRSYLIEIGGELRARGARSDGASWKVAVEWPLPGDASIQSVVDLRDAAIATSGDYRNYTEKDGKRYSHTIDPRTGRPVDHELSSVSVITDTAMRADALATAILVLGPEDGYLLAEREALAVQLIIRAGDRFRVKATPRFESHLLR